MKTCPFCREEIHDEAIKCRYCCSRLTGEPQQHPAEPKPQATAAQAIERVGPNQVVYVLDRDLIRFGKFSAATLGIFITVGVCIWGFDVSKAAKEVHESRDQARKIQIELGTTKEEIQAAKEKVQQAKDRILAASGEISADQTKARDLLLHAQDLVSSISDKARQATVFFARIAETTGAVNHPTGGFTVSELVKLYDFPPELDGTGQTIGIIELGGGYREADLDAYFTDLNLPRPQVTPISVLGAWNSPGNSPDDVDEMVTMNLEVAGAVAPKAHLVIYFAPPEPEGFIEAVRTAVNDEVNRPSVLLISWGSPESNWTRAAMNQMEQALEEAAARNITVVCAVGNSGASDGVADGQPHVDFPASSPWVLACGGTHLVAAAGKIGSETVWNDGARGATGGGISQVFPAPVWQQAANDQTDFELAGRGVPDVSANASPSSGFRLYFHGNQVVMGGTSAATPLWAGFIALLNQGCGRNLGNINPILYSTLGPAGTMRAISDQPAAPETAPPEPAWRTFTGWGSPDGAKLLEALRSIDARRS